MPSVLQSTFAFIGVAFLAVLWQLTLHDLVFVSFGFWRTVQPLSDFPYKCRRLYHPLLEACEDMWIDDERRVLYAACVGLQGRQHWTPSMDVFNHSGRGRGGHIAMLDIDVPGSDGMFGARAMRTPGYGSDADTALDLHGFDVEVLGDDRLRFWLINHRAPVGPDGQLLDPVKVGQNSTIEVFESRRGAEAHELLHVRTISAQHQGLLAANKIAASGNGGFVVSNDHSGLPGWRRNLDTVIGGGYLTTCTDAASPSARASCRTGASDGIDLPNGVVRGRDGLYYVPSTSGDMHSVMRLKPDGTLDLVGRFHVGMPIDNLAVDANGDIWAAAFPKLFKTIQGIFDPNVNSPSTTFKISRVGGWDGHGPGEVPEYTVTKVIEDGTGEVASGITVARHDVKTGRIFLGAVAEAFSAVCEPVKG